MSKDKIDIVVEDRDQADKSFRIFLNEDLCLDVDYDDVDHETVDAMTDTMIDLLRNHWDELLFNQHLRKYKLKRYNEDTDLQIEYPTFEQYLKS